MFTQLEAREVVTSGVAETNAFTIKANGKAFKVLIDGLYSDKILAVIRELWTNAYDSHVMAGKANVPFDCQLPTAFDPVFRVRDYGVSLTHDEVMHLYTTVFESTKEDTNEQVGKLGLGSKSPFAYGDTFTVTAWKDGEKRTYSAFIGADYVPQIALMSREPSDEPQGLEVTFPCKVDDVHAFRDRAGRVARGFDVRPNITGTSIHVDEEEVIMRGTGWSLTSAPRYAEAKQGCVIYPIDWGSIPELNETQKAILRAPILIDFPIGELEINASREALGYDETTCRNILKRVDQIKDEIVAQYTDMIKAAKTYWEAVNIYTNLTSSGLNHVIKTVIGNSITFHGRPLCENIYLDLYKLRAADDVSLCSLDRDDFARRKKPNFYRLQRANIYVNRSRIYLEPLSTNLKTGKVSGVSCSSVRIAHDWAVNSGTAIRAYWFKANPNSIAWKRVLVKLGRPEVIDVSKLPMPPVEKRESIRKKTRLKVVTDGSLIERDIEDGIDALYVKMERHEIIRPYRCAASTPSDLSEIKEILERHAGITCPLIAVPKSCISVLDRNPQWRDFFEVAYDWLQKNFDAQAWATAAAWQDVVKHYGDTTNGVRKLLEIGLFPKHPGPAFDLFSTMKTALEEVEKSKLHLDAIKVNYYLGAGYVFAPQTIPVDEQIEAFDKRYVLTEYMFSRLNRLNQEELEHVIEYVNAIDERHLNEHTDINEDGELELSDAA